MKSQKFSFFTLTAKLIIFSLFIFLTVWWVLLKPLNPTTNTEHARYIWGGVYQVIAYLGGFIGLIISRQWAGFKSLMGRVILAFSVGLLLQGLGQTIYTFYLFKLNIEAPYPSLGDIGYFGSVLVYIYAVIVLCKLNGATNFLQSLRNRIYIAIFSFIILFFSYTIFLRGYEFDWSNKLTIFLDFGYPLGQALYLSIAVIALLLIRKFSNGILKNPIVFLIIALVVQYISDFMFLYQNHAGTWYVGGINDYLYAVSYFLMTLAIIYIGNTFQKIRSENLTASVFHPEAGTSSDKLFNQILVEIIKRQTRVGGELAWEQVQKVHGIVINDEATINVLIVGNPKEIIDQLVYNYKNLFGDIAVEVSKNSVRYLIAELPNDQMPDSLK